MLYYAPLGQQKFQKCVLQRIKQWFRRAQYGLLTYLQVLYRDDYNAWITEEEAKSNTAKKTTILQEMEAKNYQSQKPKGGYMQPMSHRLMNQQIIKQEEYNNYISDHSAYSDDVCLTHLSELQRINNKGRNNNRETENREKQ